MDFWLTILAWLWASCSLVIFNSFSFFPDYSCLWFQKDLYFNNLGQLHRRGFLMKLWMRGKWCMFNQLNINISTNWYQWKTIISHEKNHFTRVCDLLAQIESSKVDIFSGKFRCSIFWIQWQWIFLYNLRRTQKTKMGFVLRYLENLVRATI